MCPVRYIRMALTRLKTPSVIKITSTFLNLFIQRQTGSIITTEAKIPKHLQRIAAYNATETLFDTGLGCNEVHFTSLQVRDGECISEKARV